MANKYAVASGLWSSTATWSNSDGGAAGAAVPADGDAVFILINVAVQMDADLSAYTGLLTVTIRGHATTPAMLYFMSGTSGYLKIRTGYSLVGTSGAAKGRLLANDDGVWANTGALAFANKAVIDLGATSTISAQYLDIRLYCYNSMAHTYLRTYGVRHTVTVDATANNFTKATHGLANATPVMIMSSGAIPAPLEEDTIYYVVNTATNTFQLAYWSGGTAIDLTDAGSGTIEVYTGAANGASPVNVFEDVSAETGWTNATGHNRACVVNGGPLSYTYDQQRVTITTLAASTITLSAALDSLQYPGARIGLSSRNVSIRSACTTNINIVSFSSATSSSGVFQCEIVATAGSGTTFYGYGIGNGTGHTISGTVMRFTAGVYSIVGGTIPGVIMGCLEAVRYCPQNPDVSGLIMGCNAGVNGGMGGTVSGVIFGCQSAMYSLGPTLSVAGVILGCCSAISGAEGIIAGTIRSCLNGTNGGMENVVSGTIKCCTTGFAYGRNTLTGVLGPGNQYDVSFVSVYSGTELQLTVKPRATLPAAPVFLNRNLGVTGTTDDQGIFFEDDGRVLGASRAVKQMGDLIKNTATVRSGGAGSSLEVVPQSNCSATAPLKICEWTEIGVPALAQTKSIYVKGEAWSSFPTAAQLYLEAEYVSDGSTFATTVVASTEVLTDNTTWVELTTGAFTPAVAGTVRYRAYLKAAGAGCKVYVDAALYG